MSEHSVEVVETKLDILIGDFQRFRENDREKIRKLYQEIHTCNKEITEIQTTLSWYKRFTGILFGAIASIIVYKFKGV